ncbi:hypothetical protein [Cryobacterium sp. TMT4-10]|uniref:hypothetical protein n=1 Tax=Cryobacterium sp. TMT4-10 TaxID=1259256 RepID=UPI00106CC142|nr:hypothetical protein [Cryobacterium sp. TMT4-10]TFD17842.1 hypothetical protein E3T42_06840 [Cryobacterium sp. TMT4-10]
MTDTEISTQRSQPETVQEEKSVEAGSNDFAATNAVALPPNVHRKWPKSLGQVHGIGALAIIVLSAVIAGFADPNYGVNWMSLRLLLTFVAVFLVLNYGGASVKRIVGFRGREGYRARISARPVYLLIILITVLFGRGTGVNPALVFGSVLALDYGLKHAGDVRTAFATIAGALWAAALGLAAFAGYRFLCVHPISSLITWERIDPQSAFLVYQASQFGNVAIGEFFSTLCIAALSSLPIALLPFAFLDGASLWRWNRIVWAVVYALGAAVYSFVLVPLPASWDEITISVSAWAGIYLVYAALAVSVWMFFRFTRGGRTDAVPDPS